MVETENKSERNFPKVEHTSPIRNTSGKLSSMLNNRTLRDKRQLPDPYKQTPSDSIITSLTHLMHCHERTENILRSFNLDSQRITQSSQAIQSALDSISSILPPMEHYWTLMTSMKFILQYR